MIVVTYSTNLTQRWTRVTFIGPGSDPTHKRPTRDPTRPDQTRLYANAMRYITDYIFTIKKQRCAKY